MPGDGGQARAGWQFSMTAASECLVALTARRTGGVHSPRGEHAWPTQTGGLRVVNPLVERLRRHRTSEAALAVLDSSSMEERGVEAGGSIVREAQRCSRLHIILEGWACQYVSVQSGRQTVGFLLPGDICNLDALQSEGSAYGVTAMTACKIAALHLLDVRRAALAMPELSWALLRLAFEDSAALMNRAACLGRRSARERLAHLICELHHRTASSGMNVGESYLLPATQDDLADILGLTAVHVNRTLQSLRADRLITLQTRWLTILDWEGLVALADYSPPRAHLSDF